MQRFRRVLIVHDNGELTCVQARKSAAKTGPDRRLVKNIHET